LMSCCTCNIESSVVLTCLYYRREQASNIEIRERGVILMFSLLLPRTCRLARARAGARMAIRRILKLL